MVVNICGGMVTFWFSFSGSPFSFTLNRIDTQAPEGITRTCHAAVCSVARWNNWAKSHLLHSQKAITDHHGDPTGVNPELHFTSHRIRAMLVIFNQHYQGSVCEISAHRRRNLCLGIPILTAEMSGVCYRYVVAWALKTKETKLTQFTAFYCLRTPQTKAWVVT